MPTDHKQLTTNTDPPPPNVKAQPRVTTISLHKPSTPNTGLPTCKTCLKTTAFSGLLCSLPFCPFVATCGNAPPTANAAAPTLDPKEEPRATKHLLPHNQPLGTTHQHNNNHNNNNHHNNNNNHNHNNNDDNNSNHNNMNDNSCVASDIGCRRRALAPRVLDTFLAWPIAFVAAQRKSLVALVSGIDRVRRLGSGFPYVQCAPAIRLPSPLVARTDAETIYLFWCLFCPVSLPDCFDPAVGLGHGLCRARTPGNPAGGSPVRCKETLPVGVVALTAMTKKTNAETKGDIIQKLFLRVVVPMALKQVLPQPDPCPASSVPRGRLAPAPGVNAAAAGTGDGRRNRLPASPG